MDDLPDLAARVRLDRDAFARDVAGLRATLADGLGVDAAARGLETALGRAARQGRLGFEEMGRAAVRALAQVAAEALKLRIGGESGGGAGLASLLAPLLGAPGRATGGLVAPDRPYRVGERGPEWFVPASSGAVLPNAPARAVSVTVSVNVPREAAAAPMMARTGQQVARAVKRALERA